MTARRTSGIAELNDLVRNSDGLSILAASNETASKSAVGFEKASQDTWKETSKQAWAPTSRQNLSSSSSRFSGSVEPNYRGYAVAVGVVPSIESLNNFGRAEDHIFLNDLKRLRDKFEEADTNGDGGLDQEEFINMFDSLFGLKGKNQEEILTFFNKIDYNCDGSIDWDEFCTYMYLEFHERDDVEFRSKKVEFELPAVTVGDSPHKESICRIINFNDGAMVTCSTDGVICFWSHKLTPRRIRNTEPGQTGKPKWVTDMALCFHQSKILLTTGDHEIQFYEMQNFEPYCQLRRLESVPLKLHFWYDSDDHNKTITLIGDKEGTITIITTKNILEAFKYWKLGPKTAEGMPTYNISKLITEGLPGTNIYRWKLHTNWVSEVCYFPTLNNFASCSCDPVNSLVLGSPSGSTPIDALLHTSRQISVLSSSSIHSSATSQATPNPTVAPSPLLLSQQRPKTALPAKNREAGDQRVFRVDKGVSTFDYCSKHNALVTGSLDQIIRIWNPFIPLKPISSLFGQGSPIFAVRVESPRDRIYSISNDNTVKVWHILDYCCLYTIVSTAHKVFTPVEAFAYNPVYKCVAMGTEQLSLLQQVVPNRVRGDIVQSHSHPLSAVRYSPCFKQVITACEGAMVKVWDIYTGRAVFEFKTEETSCRTISRDAVDGISALEVDKSGKRLVTGTQNGQLKLWNYNNGHCIRILDKENSSEVTDIKFVSLNNNKYIASVGWDRKINLFPDVNLTNSQTHQKPIQAWSLASGNAHAEDILCVAFDASHLMATSSFDGEVLVWSVISCHVLCRLRSQNPKRKTASSSTLQDEDAVHKVLFLEKRVKSRVAATLVASGPAGYVHFWNVYDTSGPMGRYLASQSGCITCLDVDSKNAVLVTADCDGYVCFWNIKSYCTTRRTSNPPKKISLWRAHTQRIPCIELVEQCNVLITASIDGSVRMWTYEGHYIGSFGQEKRWQLGVPASYQHPLAPSDTLRDPSSLSQLKEKLERKGTVSIASEAVPASGDAGSGGHGDRKDEELSVESVVSVGEESRGGSDREEREKSTSVFDLSECESTTEDDDDDESLLKSYISTEVPRGQNYTSAGKRLRHLRTQSAHRQHSARSSGVYTTLPYQTLSEDPQFKPPPSLFKKFGTAR